MSFGKKVRERREVMGMSQADLAEKVGMHASRISAIESGAHPQVNIPHLREIARALGVSADYLIGTWEETTAGTEAKKITTRRGRPRKPRPEAIPAAAGPPQ